MWILLNNFRHPLYKKGMKMKDYVEIVKEANFDYENLECSE